MPGACCSFGVCRVQPSQEVCEDQFAGRYFEDFDCDVVDCELGQVLGACCLPDDSCALTTRFVQDPDNPSCLDRGGDFQGEGTICVGADGVGICDPPPPIEGCIQPRPDRAAGRGWSPNLCQNAVFLPTAATVDLFTVFAFANPGVTFATVRALPTSLELETPLGVTVLDYDDFPTVSALVAGINALFNWVAESLPGARDFPTAALDMQVSVATVVGESNAYTFTGTPAEDTGEMALSTPHPIRAMPGRLELDPCAHHRGDLVIDDDGFASTAFCSQPTFGDETTRQWSLAELFVVDSDPNGFVAPGDAYFAGAYHAPLFTEAHLRSHKMRCDILR